MIKNNTIEIVKNHIRIEEIIGDFVSLKKKGNNLWANCPFHNERTPSFSVSPNKGIYKCFGCDAKGDAINFLMELEGMTFVDAIKYIAKRYGVEIEEDNEKVDFNKNEKEFLYIIYDLAKEYFKNNLYNTDEGKQICLKYLENRNIDKKFIDKFDIGFSLNDWEGFYNFAKHKGYSKDKLINTGLIIHKEERNRIYDRFRSRVIFPIHNVYGKVIAFAGRKLSEHIEGPKYINSPESLIFHKSNILYGIYHAKKSLKEENNCFLVEGYTDVISLHSINISNVVASGGTSLTENQIKLISRFTKNVTIIFDGDDAGILASLRSIDIILNQGLNVKIVVLPKGEDPDSFIRSKGSKDFKTYLQDNTKDFITYKANILTQNIKNDPVKRAEAISDIMKSILAIPDRIKRTIFIKECSKILEINEDVLVNEYNQINDNIVSSNFNENNKLRLPNKNLNLKIEDIIKILEKEIVSMLLKYSNQKLSSDLTLKEYILNEIEEIQFFDHNCKIIIEEFRNQNAADINYFLNIENIELKNYVIDLIATKNEMSNNWEDRLGHHITKEENNLENSAYKNILKLKLYTIRKLIIENQEFLKTELKSDELQERLNIHSYLKSKEKDISQKLGIVALDIHKI
ncbi:MAG: DNA primase [Bacteroidetes bacterium]|nr:DNA primase [Bacteroidota bacterium]